MNLNKLIGRLIHQKVLKGDSFTSCNITVDARDEVGPNTNIRHDEVKKIVEELYGAGYFKTMNYDRKVEHRINGFPYVYEKNP